MIYLLVSMKRNLPPSGRGRPRGFDTDQALDKAMRVFWEKGYLGTSLSDLTKAMGINRPSLYSAFGNKESLYRKVLDRYAGGPSAYLRESLKQPTARAVASFCLRHTVDLLTAPKSPRTCLWVHGTLSCGGTDDPLAREMAAGRVLANRELRKRFRRAQEEGDLPRKADPGAMANFVQAVSFGLTILASTGASRSELLCTMETALDAWPRDSEAGIGERGLKRRPKPKTLKDVARYMRENFPQGADFPDIERPQEQQKRDLDLD